MITELSVDLTKLEAGFKKALDQARKYSAEIDKLSKASLSSGGRLSSGGISRGGTTGDEAFDRRRERTRIGIEQQYRRDIKDRERIEDSFAKSVRVSDSDTYRLRKMYRDDEKKSTADTIRLQKIYHDDEKKGISDTIRLQKMYRDDEKKGISDTARLQKMYQDDNKRDAADTIRLKKMYRDDEEKNNKRLRDQASKDFKESEKQREDAIKKAIREVEVAEKIRSRTAAFDVAQAPLAPSQRMASGVRRIVQEFREDLGKSPSLVSRLTASFQRLRSQALVPMQKTWEKFTDTLKHTIGPIIGISGVVGIGAFIGYAVKLNREYQTQKLALGEVLALTTKVVDAKGNEIEKQREVNYNLKDASKLIEKVRAESFRTVLRAPELVRVFQQTLGFAVRTGFKPEQAIRPIAQIANLAKSLGARDEREVQFEERSLFTGRNVARGRIGQILGLTKADVQNAQHAGTFIQFLNTVLKAGQPYMDRYARSFEGVTTTLQTKFQLLTQLSTEKTFEKITSRLVSLNQQLTRQKISDFAERISNSITHAYDVIEHFAKSDTLKQFGDFFKILIDHAPTIISVLGAFQTFKGIKKIGDMIPGPIGLGIKLGGAAVAAAGAYYGEDIIKNEASAASKGFETEALRKRTGERFANEKRKLDELQNLRGNQRNLVNKLRFLISMAGSTVTPGVTQASPTDSQANAFSNRLVIEQRSLDYFNKRVREQTEYARKVGIEDRNQKTKDAATDRELQRVKREFNSKENSDARDLIALNRIKGRQKNQDIDALHAALEAEILSVPKKITSEKIRQQAIHELNIQYHNKRLAIEDDDKTATLQDEAEVAENRGKTIRKLLLDEKAFRSERLKELHQGSLTEAKFQERVQANHVATQKKITDTRREAFESLKQLQLKEVDLARDTAEKKKNLLQQIRDAERNYAKEQLQFIRDRKDAERSLTDTIRNEIEARENLASHRENRAIRQRLAAIVNEQPAGRTVTGAGGSTFISQGKSIRDQIYQAQLRSIGAENPALGKGQVADLAAQETQRQIRELEDLASGPGGAMKVSEKLRGQGINLSREQQGQLAALSVRQGIAEQGQQGLEEERADTAAERAVADASRAVADAQQHLTEVNQKAAEAAQAYTERQAKLQEELSNASREYQRALIDLSKEANKAAEALRGIGGGRPAAIDAAFSMPAFSRLGGGSSKFVGVGLPRGVAGPPTPLELMPDRFQMEHPAVAVQRYSEAHGGAVTAASHGGAGGHAVVHNHHYDLGNLKIGHDTKETLEHLGKQLQRDSRRTP